MKWGKCVTPLWGSRLRAQPVRSVGLSRRRGKEGAAGQGNRVVLSSRKDLATGRVWERVPGEGEKVSQSGAAGQLKVGRQLGSCDWSLIWVRPEAPTTPLPPSNSFPVTTEHLLYTWPGAICCTEEMQMEVSGVFFFLSNYYVSTVHNLSPGTPVMVQVSEDQLHAAKTRERAWGDWRRAGVTQAVSSSKAEAGSLWRLS